MRLQLQIMKNIHSILVSILFIYFLSTYIMHIVRVQLINCSTLVLITKKTS